MKGKTKQRIMAAVLTLVMTVSLLPLELFGGVVQVKAATKTIDFSSGLTAGTVYGDPNEISFVVLEDMPAKADSAATVDGVDYPCYVQGKNNASPKGGDIPTTGAAFKITAAVDGKITFVTKSASKTYHFVRDNAGTADEIKTDIAVPTGALSFDVQAGNTYYFYLDGSKACVYGVSYTFSDYKKTAVDVSGGLLAASEYGDPQIATIHVLEDMPVKADSAATVDGVDYPCYVQGKNNASPKGGDIPTTGAAFKITAVADGKITFVTKSASKTYHFVRDDAGTADEIKTDTAVPTGALSFDIQTGNTYYFYLDGSKVCVYGIVLEKGTPEIDWSTVADPVLNAPTVSDGTISVPYDAVIGETGGEQITVDMLKDGVVVDTKVNKAPGTSGTLEFKPSETGTYTFVGKLERDGKESKISNEVSADFALPLDKPVIRAGASKGNGSIVVEWNAVPEADSYKVYCDNVLAGTTESTSYVVTGLTVGQEYALTVAAVRGAEEGPVSDEFKVTATQEAQTVWAFTRYGSSTDDAHNGYIGDANEGSVTVYSEGGKGKIVPASTDGVAFYYTAVPTDTNFTLRANVHVDNWTMSNGQEGFGLLATDRLGPNGDATDFWNNQYMACASKVEYYWNSDKQEVSTTGDKYTMKCGIGVIEKTGVTKDNLAKLQASDTETVKNEFSTVTTTLDTSAPKAGLETGTYNIIGNATSPVEGTFSEITDFVLEIQKNNTGYFITYLDQEGNVINQQKYYNPDALNQLDSDNVYVGFFASRNARATFSNIQFSTIPASEDAPAESRPITMIEPTFTVQSAKVSNSADYTLSMLSNVAGTVRIRLNGTTLEETYPVKADVRCDYPIVFTKDGTNSISLKFTPDAAQELPEYTALANADPIKVTQEVKWSNKFAGIENLYVSPEGKSSGDGTKEKPLDIYSAINFVQPGQTIILMEGTYDLEQTVKIERGIDGTAEQNIRMIADPEATSRPVLDFAGRCPGVVIGGDYWYFSGFDVTRSQNAQKGIQVSGSNNVLDNINAYHNGNTGIQISRMYSSDATIEDWPANNLILNCTSYGNADAGYEDADGFAAKLTVGEGNVFDGCVAYNNADDGWDLFAKVETGPIGSVTIKNCVAYANGYLEDGTNAGNGNGFKMGGSSITGYHKLINSYAFFNKAKGIDSNSCPDIQVENSISYNNESYNVAFYTNTASKTDFAATGIISFKDSSVKSGLDQGDSFKKISQDESKYLNDTNYYWNGTQSANTSGATATADWFKSLEFTGVTRNVDGTINMHGFLELTDVAPAGIGAVPGGTPSQIELTQKLKADVSVSIPETVLTDEVKKATGCNTVDELVVYLKTQVEKNDAAKKILGDVSNSAVYEVTILTSIDGINWIPVTEENFPAKGVNVILPYPDGTNKNDFDFVVAHLITMNCNGEKAGTIEYLKPDKTRTGLKVHVNSASPFAIGFAEVEYEEELASISSVKTGDTTPVAPLLALMLASAGICGVYVFRRKRSF